MSVSMTSPEGGHGSTPPRGRPEAAGTIWDWRGSSASRQRDEEKRRARVRGLVQAAVGLGIAAVLYLAFHFRILPAVVAGIALVTGALAVVSPTGAYDALHRILGRFAFLVGRALTWLMLVPLFYAFFLPFGLALRRGPRDPMERRLDARAPTYWRRRPAVEVEPGHYERQF